MTKPLRDMPAFDLLMSALKSEAGFTDAQCQAVRQAIVGLQSPQITTPTPRALLVRDVRAAALKMVRQGAATAEMRERLMGMGVCRRTAFAVMREARDKVRGVVDGAA